MDVLRYDFESELEQGFKALFDAAGFTLLIADNYADGEIPDEALLMTLTVGGAISDEHKKPDAGGHPDGIYNHYGANLEFEVRTHRVNADEPTDARFKNRHNELVANVRKLLEEIGSAELATHWGNVTPVMVLPSGTERENDESARMSMLSYSVQFRVA